MFLSMFVKCKKVFLEIVKDNAECSCLTYPQSNAIKGLLILLIVLAHDKYLMQDSLCFSYLYSFHVYSFYFLPFLYDFKVRSSFSSFLKNKIRLFLVPYTIIFWVLLVPLLLKRNVEWWSVFVAYVTGSQFNLRNALDGGGFLWFIPTMFSLVLLRYVYYNVAFKIRLFFLFCSAICWVCYAFGFFGILQVYSPMSMFIALAMLLPSVIIRYVILKIDVPKITLWYFLLTIIVCFIFPMQSVYPYMYRGVKFIICPVVIFAFVCSLRVVLAENSFLINVGKKSYSIYIYHIFLYNVLYFVLDKYGHVGLMGGFFLFVFVFIVSYYTSQLKITSLFFLNKS